MIFFKAPRWQQRGAFFRICETCFTLSLLLTALLWYASQADAQPNQYLEDLIKTAQEKNLASDIAWQRLLHYKPNSLRSGVTSFVDDADFFISPSGKTAPRAELQATLRAFFADPSLRINEQHPQCAFIGRFRWLKKKLELDQTKLVHHPCPRFESWISALDPSGITLIYPAAYLNNPASSFGHTLLRIDTPEQSEQTRLLAYTANYAANTEGDGGFLFALKGLLGGYQGYFSVSPYYLKVRKYSDIENRDIWEYRLNLTKQEVRQLLAHVWELRSIHFDYYFFDENCSYHLLSLIEAARPSLTLTEQFPAWVIPVDTIRVLQAANVIESASYRPSNSSILNYRLAQASPEQQQLAKQIALDENAIKASTFTTLSADQQADTLELSYEYLNYLWVKSKAQDKKLQRRTQTILSLRSRLPVRKTQLLPAAPHVRPEQGHRTSRFSFGAGLDDSRYFSELRIRPAYHDLLDSEGGYPQGSQINFFDLRLRHYESSKPRLESFIPLDIVSLAPRNEFIKPISWRFKLGTWRIRKQAEKDRLVLGTELGAGLAYTPFNRVLLFGLSDLSFLQSGGLRDNYALGLGAQVGAQTDISPAWRIKASGSILRYGIGDEHTAQNISLSQRYAIKQNLAIKAILSRDKSFTNYWTSFLVSGVYYF